MFVVAAEDVEMKMWIVLSFALSFAFHAFADEEEPMHFRVEITITAKAIRVGSIQVESGYARRYLAPTDEFHITVLNQDRAPIRELSFYDPLLLRIYERSVSSSAVQEHATAHAHKVSGWKRVEETDTLQVERNPTDEEVVEKYERIAKNTLIVFIPYDPNADTLQLTYRGKRQITAKASLLEAIRVWSERQSR